MPRRRLRSWHSSYKKKKICEILLKSQPKNGKTILENIRMLLGFVIKLEVDKRTTVQL